MVSYDNLVKILQDNGLIKSDLTQVLGISSRTIVKIGKGEKIADNVLQKIADYFGCLVEDLYGQAFRNFILKKKCN
jgi:DNA-binding Xre family transcriptional regulator